ALDVDSLEQATQIAKEIKDYVGIFKIGSQLYSSEGHEVVKAIKKIKGKIFLDLKYHDIPNTVKGAASAATELGVYMFNVHCLGGKEMMRAAVEGAKRIAEKHSIKKPKIIGVTLLTCIDEVILKNELLIEKPLTEYVLHLAKMAQQSGLDGIVCSANDIDFLKPHFDDEFMFVTPGIKGVSTSAGADQKRVSSPSGAVKAGSSILVIGRAITNAKSRKETAYEILKDIEGAL
ncbi:MAG: orotidine-5'-phosphate decarboxylase, partial [Candidatus Aenigmarchaeota archaeon]|nr:orotidine-5'-phosphate decarboxylase [Candidatus Aenigmarchaeota archaeon]